MDSPRLTGLFIYPIKSARGISLPSATLTDRGLQHDRRWMVVDGENKFLTQRTVPKMALISVELGQDGLLVRAAGATELRIPTTLSASETLPVRVWEDVVESRTVTKEADRWFTGVLGISCRLVYMPDDALRVVNPQYGHSRVSFADAFPLHLISDASLADLNRRLRDPVPMNRFRPNLVVSGCEPYAEDAWSDIRIGTTHLRFVKPCARCTVPTVDQDTGSQGKDPIHTLAMYRTKNNKVVFGQNVVHEGRGTLALGDPIEIIRSR